MPRRTISLSDTAAQDLRRGRDHDPHPDVRERCAAILKIAAGESPHHVARAGLLRPRDPDTVYSWLGRYQGEGIAGLRQHRHGGPRRGHL